jgi:uncharacterized protein YecE (DUF72 family)
MRCAAPVSTGYPQASLDVWAARAQRWASGAEPEDLPRVEAPAASAGGRDVFVYFISGAKERAPAAAVALLQRLGSP